MTTPTSHANDGGQRLVYQLNRPSPGVLLRVSGRGVALSVFVHTDRIAVETLKLLVGIAWADKEVSIEEMNFILTVAERAGVSADEGAALRNALSDGQNLPQPDMQLLRQHREDVLRSVDLFISIDDKIVEDERTARDAIARMLR